MAMTDIASLQEENRQLRFKLQNAHRRIHELSGLDTAVLEQLASAFQEECRKRDTTPEFIIGTKKDPRVRPLRYACVRAVCDRFRHVGISDLARFFGVDRHFIYDVMRSEP